MLNATVQVIVYSPTLNKYVIGGNSSSLATSTDGVSWTHNFAFTSNNNAIIDMTWGNNLFVAVTNMWCIYTSADGDTWTQRAFTNPSIGYLSGGFNSVIYAGGTINLFVAVGINGVIATSPNGTTWTTKTSNTSVDLSQVCFNTSLNMIAIAGAKGLIITSTDGITFAQRVTMLASFIQVSSLESKGFVAKSVYYACTSTDGINWIPTTPTAAATVGKSFYSSVDNCVFSYTNTSTVANNPSPQCLQYTTDGKTYTSEHDNMITDDSGDDEHRMYGQVDFFDYFKPITKVHHLT